MDIVENKFNVRLSICKEDEKSIRITYRKLIVSVEVVLRIERITEDEIVLSYVSGMGIDFLIQGAVITLGKNIPGCISINPDIHEITVLVDEIESLQKVFDKISPDNLYVEDNGVGLEFRLKNVQAE